MKNHAAYMLLIAVFLIACQPKQPETLPVDELQNPVSKQLQQQFEQWKQQQDPMLLAEYQQYVAQRIQQPLSLFALSYNGHRMPKQCEALRFSIPSKNHWPNLIPSLKLIEQLQAQGLFQHYRIISTFRSSEMNDCIQGAAKSKHVFNYAVDFKVLDAKYQPYSRAEYQKIEQQFCQFWSSQGRKLNMGLGIYPRHSFHIDAAGHRTWGSDYHGKSSPCLNQYAVKPKA